MQHREAVMEERDIERVAARVIAKLLEPTACGVLAIAKQLRQLTSQYESDMSRLGERLERQHF